jgi:ribonuclease J
MEEEIVNICKTFSVQNKKQDYNLIESLKQNCRRIVREKTGKKPYTRINLTRI